jgi:hypothetical protein
MKFVRYDAEGRPRVGVVKGDGVVDLVAAGCRRATMIEIIQGGSNALDAVANIVARADASLRLDTLQLLAPIVLSLSPFHSGAR